MFMEIIKKRDWIRRFATDETGLAAIEYGLLAAGIAIGLWSIISGISTDLQTIFTHLATDVTAAAGG
jgi:pilus assembly protein Flp/PilA